MSDVVGSGSVWIMSQLRAGRTISGVSAVCREVWSARAPMKGLVMPPMLTVRPRVTPLAVPTRVGR
jgi:hypothetical protein